MLLGEIGTRLLEPLPGVHFGFIKKDTEELLLAPASDRVKWPEPCLQGKEKVSIQSRVSGAAAAWVFALVDPDDAEHERAPGSLGARDLMAQDDLAKLPSVGTGRLVDEGPLDLRGTQFAIACRELTVDRGSIAADAGAVAGDRGSIAGDSGAESDRGSSRGLLTGLAGQFDISRSLIRIVAAGSGPVSLACRCIATLPLPVAPCRGLGAKCGARHSGH